MPKSLHKSKDQGLRLPVKQMRKLCLQSLPLPNMPGPWKVILETMGPNYLEAKAYELLDQAMKCINNPEGNTYSDIGSYDMLITEVQALLTVARYKRGSYLHREAKKYVVIQTQYGLAIGDPLRVNSVTTQNYQEKRDGGPVEGKGRTGVADTAKNNQPPKDT